MTNKEPDLRPIAEQVQRWWDLQHVHQAEAPEYPDRLGRPFIHIDSLFQEDLGFEIQLCPMFCGWQNGRSEDDLVASLRHFLKASAVDAAQLLSQPDIQVARRVATALMPTPFGDELTLVASLIELAGAQTAQQRDRAFAGVGLAVVALFGFWLFGRGGQG